MRTIAEAALEMMRDVANAKDENDQTLRVMRHIEARDVEVAEHVRADEARELREMRTRLFELYHNGPISNCDLAEAIHGKPVCSACLDPNCVGAACVVAEDIGDG